MKLCALGSIILTSSPINTSLFSVQNAFSTYANRYNKVSIDKSGNPGQYGGDDLQVSVQGTLFSGGCVVDDAVNYTAACQHPAQTFANHIRFKIAWSWHHFPYISRQRDT